MPSINSQPFSINGVIDTSKSVMQNLQELSVASGCWITFDITTGKWSVIINQTGTSIASFNDSNIIGAINITGTGITELYNSCRVVFAHRDLNDIKDWILVSIPAGERFDNEQENTLEITSDLINDPIQAQIIASRELKQSRIDKIIQFRTDFSKFGLRAGDLIDVTTSMYGFTNKIFRIISISEEDGDDNNIVLDITALEYDADIYNTTGLVYTVRDRSNDIPPKSLNAAVELSDQLDQSASISDLLIPLVGTSLLNLLFSRNPITGKISAILNPTDSIKDIMLNSISKGTVSIGGSTEVCAGGTASVSVTVANPCSPCFTLPSQTYTYTITGVDAADITPFALTGTFTLGVGTQNFSIPISNSLASNKTLTFTVGSQSRNINLIKKLGFTYVTTASPTSITEGASSTVTLTTTNVANGTVIPYAITGSATGKVTTPLTGNVTVNSNTATLVINTTDDAVYTGTQSLLITFNSALSDPCNELDKTASITVLDNETPPPPDTTCEYVSVPVVWCGTYDGTDNQLKSVSAVKSALFAKPLAGEATINLPKTVSVTKGNPSTITVTSTEAVSAGTNMGGIAHQVITSFNTVGPNGLITGTTTTVYGY